MEAGRYAVSDGICTLFMNPGGLAAAVKKEENLGFSLVL